MRLWAWRGTTSQRTIFRAVPEQFSLCLMCSVISFGFIWLILIDLIWFCIMLINWIELYSIVSSFYLMFGHMKLIVNEEVAWGLAIGSSHDMYVVVHCKDESFKSYVPAQTTFSSNYHYNYSYDYLLLKKLSSFWIAPISVPILKCKPHQSPF